MGMNPDTNRMEMLTTSDELEKLLEREKELKDAFYPLVRPNGMPVPKIWSVFKIGEEVVIKDYTFKVAYLGETSILFEPVGPKIIGEDDGVY